MKTARKSLLLAISLTLALTLAIITPVFASAVEVGSDVSEVRIPLVFTTNGDAVAGAEIEFSYTGGLEYVGYQPTSDAENQVGTQIGDKTYAGFFSATNRYTPTNGSLAFGSLVFHYTGSQPESVTVSEVKLHKRSDTGVSTLSTTSAFDIPVTRATTNPGNTDPGTDPGNTNPIYPATPLDPSNPTDTNAISNIQPIAAGSGSTAVETDRVEIEVTNANGVDTSALPNASSSSSDSSAANNAATEGIPSPATPLASNETGGVIGVISALQQAPIWTWILAIVALAAAVFLITFFARRRDRDEEELPGKHQRP
jgi:hypothetical protein